MAVNIGPRIGIEGEAEYRKQLQNIIQQQKTLSAEMKATASAFNANTSAQEKARAKAENLSKQIDLQRQRVEAAKRMVEESAKAYGEADTRTLKWRQALAEATADLNNMESELSATNDEIENLGDGFEDATDSVDDAADSLDDASDALEDSSDAAGHASDGWSAFGQVVANIVTDVLRKAVDMAKEFGSGMIEAAAEAAASNAQFSQTFGELEGQASQMVESIAADTGIISTRLRDSAASVYAFARASGASTSEAMTLTEQALRVAADAAAYYDMSLEDATETVLSFIKGNYANDAALGLSATEATRNAAAYELFGVKFNELTEIQKQQTLLHMVEDAQRLSGAVGQASRESDGWANVTGNLAEEWRKAQVVIGTPVLEGLIPVVQDLTADMNNFTENVLPGIVEGFEWFIKNLPTIRILIIGLGAALVAYNWVGIVMGISSAVIGAAGAFKAFGAALLANPVGIVIIGITLLVATIKYLWDNCEWFRDAVKAVLAAIVSAAKSVYDWVVNAFRDIGNFFTVTIPSWFKTAMSAVSGFVSNIKARFDEIRSSITAKINAARDAVKNAIEKIKGFFNFKVSLPHIPMPHFSVQPPGWKIGDLLKGTIPSLSVSWYKKAYDNPVVFTRPTVLPTANGLMGFGDGRGAEVVIGMNRLEELVAANRGTYAPQIYVYGAPGQDVGQLADEVMRRMQYQINRRVG